MPRDAEGEGNAPAAIHRLRYVNSPLNITRGRSIIAYERKRGISFSAIIVANAAHSR